MGTGASGGSEALRVPASMTGAHRRDRAGSHARQPGVVVGPLPHSVPGLGCCGRHGGSEDVTAGGQQPPHGWFSQGRRDGTQGANWYPVPPKFHTAPQTAPLTQDPVPPSPRCSPIHTVPTHPDQRSAPPRVPLAALGSFSSDHATQRTYVPSRHIISAAALSPC